MRAENDLAEAVHTSFQIATAVLLLTESPNFLFIIEKVDSTLCCQTT